MSEQDDWFGSRLMSSWVWGVGEVEVLGVAWRQDATE
jgi:hypothetical protein